MGIVGHGRLQDVVYKKNQRHYALKVLNKAQLVKKKVIRSAMVEKDALIALGTQPNLHPGVVRLHHCFQDTAHLCLGAKIRLHIAWMYKILRCSVGRCRPLSSWSWGGTSGY